MRSGNASVQSSPGRAGDTFCDSPDSLGICDGCHNTQNESPGTTSSAITQIFLNIACLLNFSAKIRRIGPIAIFRAGQAERNRHNSPHSYVQTSAQSRLENSLQKQLLPSEIPAHSSSKRKAFGKFRNFRTLPAFNLLKTHCALFSVFLGMEAGLTSLPRCRRPRAASSSRPGLSF